mgnify:CR=1 FL=1
MRKLLLCLVLASCLPPDAGTNGESGSQGPPGPPGPPGPSSYVDGSRLRWRIVKSADGAKVPVGLFDTKLDTLCTFEPDGQGGARCLPLPVLPQQIWTFADAGCKQPVVVGPWGKYARRYNAQSVYAGYELMPIDPLLIYSLPGCTAEAVTGSVFTLHEMTDLATGRYE